MAIPGKRRPLFRGAWAVLGARLVLCSVMTTACITPAEYGDESGGGGGGGGGQTGLYHPAGYVEARAHGLDLNMQAEDCRTCHGADLNGGTSAVSCDTAGCHTPGWRTDCTYCHGGPLPGGAPPRDIDGSNDLATTMFPAHEAHVTSQNHAAFDCVQCHAAATDILSAGHVFDDTPGRAEVIFGAGLSSSGQYDSDGGCANLYCHGTGTKPGASKARDGDKSCSSCHADATTSAAWSTMSGEHGRHLRDGMTCGDCHSAVVAGNDTITNPALHVNGVADPTMDGTGVSYSGGTCTGFCHNKGHFFDGW